MTLRRLLLDQMLDEEVAESLRAAGYDVVRVSQFGLRPQTMPVFCGVPLKMTEFW